MVHWAGLTLVTAGLFVATHVLRWRWHVKPNQAAQYQTTGIRSDILLGPLPVSQGHNPSRQRDLGGQCTN
jgi:hypothetical protein